MRLGMGGAGAVFASCEVYSVGEAESSRESHECGIEHTQGGDTSLTREANAARGRIVKTGAGRQLWISKVYRDVNTA